MSKTGGFFIKKIPANSKKWINPCKVRKIKMKKHRLRSKKTSLTQNLIFDPDLWKNTFNVLDHDCRNHTKTPGFQRIIVVNPGLSKQFLVEKTMIWAGFALVYACTLNPRPWTPNPEMKNPKPQTDRQTHRQASRQAARQTARQTDSQPARQPARQPASSYPYISIHIHKYLYISIHIYIHLYISIDIYTYLYISRHIYTYL